MKKTERDIGSFDTPGGAGLRGEFAKMRQWWGVADGIP
jgi:hypothetical protein